MQVHSENPFINNNKIPQTVFKFRDWNIPFHKKILNGEIYLSSPLDFNDPYDCNIIVGYDKLQNNPSLQHDYFTLVVERQNPHFTMQQKKDEVNRLIEEGRFNDPKWLELNAKNTRKKYCDLGIFCLTTRKDNILLWSHYANSHKGFCVGFNSEYFFYECLKQGMKGCIVDYTQEYPEIDLKTDLFLQSVKQTHTKSGQWSYEQEYRLSKLNAARRTFNVSKQCFKEITLGCEITNEHRHEIICFAKTNLPGIPIYETTIVPYKFELSFKRVGNY